MRHTSTLLALLLAVTMVPSCKKEKDSNADCFSNSLTVRQITDAQATIKNVGGKYYIVEQGSIDTRLNPCNLPEAFRVNDLLVTTSGEVKATVQVGPGPFGADNFVITKISR